MQFLDGRWFIVSILRFTEQPAPNTNFSRLGDRHDYPAGALSLTLIDLP